MDKQAMNEALVSAKAVRGLFCQDMGPGRTLRPLIYRLYEVVGVMAME